MSKAAINTQPDIRKAVFTNAVLEQLDGQVALTHPRDGNSLTGAALIERCHGVDLILTTWGALPLTGKVLQACPDLKLIVHAAGLAKGIVTEELAEARVPVSSAVLTNALPVAQFTLGSILCALRKAFSWKETFERESVLNWWTYCATGVDGYYKAKIGLFGVGNITRQLMNLLRHFYFDTHVVSGY